MKQPEYKRETNRKFADRIKTVILLNDDWNYSQVSKILLLHDSKVPIYEKDNKKIDIIT